jgi:hypothetical protein
MECHLFLNVKGLSMSNSTDYSKLTWSEQGSLSYNDLLKAKNAIDAIPKPPRIEIWLSNFVQPKTIITVPAIQHGINMSFTKDVEEIWFVHQEDFDKMDIQESEVNRLVGIGVPVFTSGGLRVM